MPISKPNQFLPCAWFFRRGQRMNGVLAFLMQVSLFLWPSATRWASEEHERTSVEYLLAEIAARHQLSPHQRPLPSKSFRPAA